MALLFKKSRETNKETLSVKLEDDQSIMRKIQAQCVSWLVNLLEIRWSSSHFRAHVSPIVQHLAGNGTRPIKAPVTRNVCAHPLIVW